MTRNRNNKRRGNTVRSVFGEYVLRGSAKQVHDKWLELAESANGVDKEGMLQQAHHWGLQIN